jgi:signal transduction histidine kinase/ligand-binding sensor domain-containing protein
MYHYLRIMIHLRNRIFLLLACLIPFFASRAQSTRKIAIRHKLSTESGLSSYNVGKILQDPYGYIWLGTQDGLNRYDGRSFIVYSRSSDSVHRLLGNVINDMVLDTARKLLWVTTSYGGLNGIDLLTGLVVHSMKPSDYQNRFASEWLKCLNIAGGHLWIGTMDGLHVYDPRKKSFRIIDALPAAGSSSPRNVTFVVPDRFGHVWVGVPAYGVVVYDAASGKIIHRYTSGELGIHQTLSFLQFASRFIAWSDNQFLWATDHGFRIITLDSAGKILQCDAKLTINDRFGDKTIFSCAKDPQGNLWFSTFDHLYAWSPASNRYETIEDIVYTPANDYLNTVMHVFFDNQDNLWLGTQYGAGVCDYRQPAIIPFYRDRKTDVQINHAYYVLPANDSLVYVAAQHGAFSVNTNSGKITALSAARRFNFIFRTPDDRFIFSNDDGIQVLSGGQLIPVANVYPEYALIQHEMLNAAVLSGDSTMLMSSEKNNVVYAWNFRRHALELLPSAIGSDEKGIINTLYLDNNNVAWMLFDNAFASYDLRTHQSQLTRLTDPDVGIPLNIYMDMCELDGDYWLAMYGKGVVQLDRQKKIKKIYGQRDGLLNTGVYTVVPFHDSLLFVTTNFGLFTIHPGRQQVRRYLMSDGLNTNNFEENCAFHLGDEIFAGGEQGISIIRPAFFRENHPPVNVFINRVVSEGASATQDTFNLFLNSVTVHNDVKQATISFAALNYAQPEQVRYAYRISQLSNDWIDLGSRNFINLIGLAPGRYTVEVKSSDVHGREHLAQPMQLYVEPKWYQTLLFRMAVVLAAVGLFYAFYRYRIAQLKKQEQIRRDIASDLHDDIGSTLNSAKIFVHLAKKDENNKSYLDLVERTLIEASIALRDIIWLLDDKRDTYADFAERINGFARPIADAQQIAFKSLMSSDYADRSLGKSEKKTFFLISKEAINNSIKHSGCTAISFDMHPDGDAHTLIICDNGRGFDVATANGGNGLGNMKYRADKIGYTVEINAVPGEGVTIRLRKR